MYNKIVTLQSIQVCTALVELAIEEPVVEEPIQLHTK